MAFGILNGMNMQLTIDQAGRVVLPKPIRDRFHLVKGAILRIVVEPDGIMLKPENRTAPLAREGNLLVHNGTASIGMLDMIEQARSERDRQVSGHV